MSELYNRNGAPTKIKTIILIHKFKGVRYLAQFLLLIDKISQLYSFLKLRKMNTFCLIL